MRFAVAGSYLLLAYPFGSSMWSWAGIVCAGVVLLAVTHAAFGFVVPYMAIILVLVSILGIVNSAGGAAFYGDRLTDADKLALVFSSATMIVGISVARTLLVRTEGDREWDE